ncbi:sugar ABC transporter permease [Paenibacillus mesophilus]|uniref:ABC transporter permease n=1 Tax=Paenibacillus mesophilus TaxID=2582849 RepID=UPI00110F4B8B|nr:ABC transporter permease subunit [Paenibacillus mesophilus]TMV44367.1 sugar ABC transporter permease [Paenibacillus mesophilus]
MKHEISTAVLHRPAGTSKWTNFRKNVIKSKYLLLLLLPGTAYLIIFQYIPMYGVIIAFKDFSPGLGIWGSEWVGFRWFTEFFQSVYAFRLLRNTVLISLYSLIWGFPIPVIFALLLNELRNGFFKRAVQTVSYFPHFISSVIIAGLIVNFLSPTDGLFGQLFKWITGEPTSLLTDPAWFRTIYIGSGIWQGFGWSSIIYLAALSAIDPQLYDAAKIDGAGRWKQMMHITLPGIMPTIVILLILNMGSLLSVGAEKIILLYSPAIYETSDVISTYAYRRGLLGADYSFGAAVGLFNSIANFLLLIIVNSISKKVNQTSLW